MSHNRRRQIHLENTLKERVITARNPKQRQRQRHLESCKPSAVVVLFLCRNRKLSFLKDPSVLQKRRMIGHFNPSKVNFTECCFQVKIYFKVEMLQLCILLLPQLIRYVDFLCKKEKGHWEILDMVVSQRSEESLRVFEKF